MDRPMMKHNLAKELKKEHFDGLKACVEVADDEQNVLVDKANEALEILLEQYPEFKPDVLSEEDRNLVDMIKNRWNLTYDEFQKFVESELVPRLTR